MICGESGGKNAKSVEGGNFDIGYRKNGFYIFHKNLVVVLVHHDRNHTSNLIEKLRQILKLGPLKVGDFVDFLKIRQKVIRK